MSYVNENYENSIMDAVGGEVEVHIAPAEYEDRKDEQQEEVQVEEPQRG